MNREQFEALRDYEGKVIRGDVRFQGRQPGRPILTAGDIRISNADEVDLRLHINLNTESTAVNITVSAPGTGPVCRLDIRHTVHGEAGRTHKHSLKTASDPKRNLPYAEERPDLEDFTPRQAFDEFCRLAKIEFQGEWREPDDES